MLQELVDVMEEHGMKEDFLAIMQEMAGAGIRGGGFHGFLQGLLHGGGASGGSNVPDQQPMQGGGVAKDIGGVANKAANFFTGGLWGSGAPEEETEGGVRVYGGKGKGQSKKGGVRVLGGSKKKVSLMTDRGDIVRQVMKQRGVSLPQASKIVKEEGLYNPNASHGSSKKGGKKGGRNMEWWEYI